MSMENTAPSVQGEGSLIALPIEPWVESFFEQALYQAPAPSEAVGDRRAPVIPVPSPSEDYVSTDLA
jgi:hypothetical protein